MQKKKRHILGLGGILLLLAAFIAWQMQQRFEAGLLWGYRPLFFYLSLYWGLLCFLFPVNEATEPKAREAPPLRLVEWLVMRWSRIVVARNMPAEMKAMAFGDLLRHSFRFQPSLRLWLATFSGLLLGFGFPGYLAFPFLLLLAFVPLLILQQELSRSQAGYKLVFFYGFHAFLLYNILATYWVTNTAFGPGIFAVLANSLLMSIPWLLFHFTARRLPKVAYLSLPAYWLVFEWTHYHWELNWPWLTLGNGFAQFPALIQWYEYTGALGGSLWILLVNILIFIRLRAADKALLRPAKGVIKRAWWGALALPILVSALLFWTYTAPARAKLQVSAIQPNFEPHFEKFSRDEQTVLDTFLLLSRQAIEAAGPTDYLIFPETSFSYIEENDPLGEAMAGSRRSSVFLLKQELSALPLSYLMMGYDGYYVFQGQEERSKAVRSIPRRDGSVLELEAINGALQLDLRSGDYQTYRKGVFVPGAESFPFRDYLWFAKPLVDALGGSIEGRGTQSERTPMLGEKAKVAPVICYESVFGEYFTHYIKEGAQAAFVMTNDGWWDHTAGYKQHLYLSSLRAIETRRDVVRSANMGACAFIDQRGVIKSQTQYGEMGFLNGEVQLNDQLTLYVRFGDYVARIALLLSILLLFSAFTKGFKRQ